MNTLIDAAFSRARTVILALIMVLVAGALAYQAIPKEAEPDVPIPIITVTMTHEGISPEDGERLLIRPMEKELRSIEGIKETRATAGEGYASLTLEFDAGFDADRALREVREKVDIARAELPPDTDEPRVREINIALFPVMTVGLAGPVPERALLAMARDLKDRIEALPGVLDVDIGGDREEVMEVEVDPTVLETYNISLVELFDLVNRNNRLVAAGAMDTGAGRMVLKVPGVIENVDDVLATPVKVLGDTVVTFKDVATIRRGFKDADGFARVNGQPAVTLEVSKRLGANIIETTAAVRDVVEAERAVWPAGVEVNFLQDKSEQIHTMLGDLENNVLTAIVLVMIVIVAALGLRPAILVGLAIPGSFLAGILVLSALGLTMNIVVLFSLILVAGMLVDGAIVSVELAERKQVEGMSRGRAYAEAAKRMAWPITASTATTLAVFLPLLFWPGMVGEFMKFLPITVLVTLAASLTMALVFIPVLGGVLPGKAKAAGARLAAARAGESGDLAGLRGFTGGYVRTLRRLLRHPGKVLAVAVVLLAGAYTGYAALGKGVEFFPAIEPELAQVQVRARGDLSASERDDLVRAVEARIDGVSGFKTVYARTIGRDRGGTREMAEDVIGVIQLELTGWRHRPPASEILETVRRQTAVIPGLILQVREEENGPSSGKPIKLELAARDPAKLEPAVTGVRALMDRLGGFVDVEDTTPLPGIEWRLEVDREKAARYGADVALLGEAVRLVTGGILLGKYRPDDADEELDIRARFPFGERNLDRLTQMRVPTMQGQVPIGNFITFIPAAKVGTLKRTDAKRVMTIQADVARGLLVDDRIRALKSTLPDAGLDRDVGVTFKGQDADQREAGAFLTKAFVAAVFLVAIILLTQFNSVYQTVLVLSAIVFSTVGVLLGLLVTGQPFGIVMGGLGVIALAGIVVNNNIILIDTFNDLRRRGLDTTEAILRTAAQRLRPVLLTSVTTVLGLLPMVFQLNIDLIGRDISFGAPSTQWWTQLASAIAGGLSFATVLTLLLTPCLLMLGENISASVRRHEAGRPRLADPARASTRQAA